MSRVESPAPETSTTVPPMSAMVPELCAEELCTKDDPATASRRNERRMKLGRIISQIAWPAEGSELPRPMQVIDYTIPEKPWPTRLPVRLRTIIPLRTKALTFVV